MWEFLTKLLEALKNVKWKLVWRELKKIPDSLKFTLVISVCTWVCYFGYQKYNALTDIAALQTEVKKLTEQVEMFVEEDDFVHDMETIIAYIKILDAAEYYNYTEQDQLLNILIKFFKEKHPEDKTIIYELEALHKRNETQRVVTQEHFKMNLQLQKIVKKHGGSQNGENGD